MYAVLARKYTTSTKADTERERERHVAPRVLDLAGGECNVIPRVGREERAGLHHGQDHYRAHHNDGALRAYLHRMQRRPARVAPELAPVLAEVGCDGRGVAANGKSHQHEGRERDGLGYRENIL